MEPRSEDLDDVRARGSGMGARATGDEVGDEAPLALLDDLTGLDLSRLKDCAIPADIVPLIVYPASP